MENKKSLNIGISSIRCWLYLNGDITKEPIRAFADANCDVFTGVQRIEKNGIYCGEQCLDITEKYVEYSPKHIIKIRDQWDGFAKEKSYGKIKTKPGNSPFINKN